ncbi:MAG: ABC transporter substrate-binding protein [Actinomycetota bacterium]
MRHGALRPRAVRVAVGVAALALVAASCGGDDGDEPAAEEEPLAEETEDEAAEPDDGDAEEDGTEDMETVTLTVGDILGTPSAFLMFAVEQGFMEEQGLDVQVEPNPGGAANIPGVESGEFEIAGSNVVSMLLARNEGLELKMISAGTFATDDPDTDFSLVLADPDGPIAGPEDLDGHSVAVNTLANIAEVTVRASLENVGAEHENIDFVEMGFPDMVPALLDGQVDAIHVIEPFMSIGLEEGLEPIIAPYAETRPGMAIGSYFSSDAFIAENPEVIDRFIAGVSAAGDYVAENPDEFREALVDLADLDPEVAESVNLPDWGGPVDVESVELIGDLMVQFGLLDEAPAIEDVVYQ